MAQAAGHTSGGVPGLGLLSRPGPAPADQGCAGIGAYLNIDPVFVRLAFVFFTLAGGAGILIYLLLLIIMPLDSSGTTIDQNLRDPEQQKRTTMLVGGSLVLVGLWYLLGQIPALAWLNFSNLWPLLLIAAGAAMLVGYMRNQEG